MRQSIAPTQVIQPSWVCHYYGIKRVSEAKPLGRAALRALSSDNDTPEHIPLHPSDANIKPETPQSSRELRASTSGQEIPLENKKSSELTWQFHFTHTTLFTLCLQELCDGEVKDRMQKWTVVQDPTLAPRKSGITPLSGGTLEGPPHSHWR